MLVSMATKRWIITMDGQQKWLEVQADSGSLFHSISRCMTLTDLNGDGDYKLVLGDNGKPQNVLKVLKGTTVVADTNLPELPSGVVALFNDNRIPRCPLVAVSSGPSLYVYRNLKPYYKFSLPQLDVNPLEVDLWLEVRNGGMEARNLHSMLLSLSQDVGFSSLSQQSQNLLLLPLEREDELRSLVSSAAPHPLSRKTVITCMTSLLKNSSEPDGISCLVLGSEDGAITLVDPEAFTVIDKIDQHEDHGTRTIPATIQAYGLLDVEYRILICNRDGKITIFRRGSKHTSLLLQLSTQPVDFVQLENTHLMVVTTTHLECYSKKGRRQWEQSLIGKAVGLAKIPLEHQGITLIAVALNGGQVCLYNGRHLVDIVSAPDTVTGMIFGRFGQEDHCLILVTVNGALLIKLLKRTAQFVPSSVQTAAQSVPKLPIPKRTRLLVEQVARERENSVEIHQGFQRGLFRLRLYAAENLVESIQKSSNLISDDPEYPLKMSAQVFGLGPTFKIRISLDNMAANLSHTPPPLRICVHYNHSLYNVSQPYIQVPHLVPGLIYVVETMISALGEVLLAEEVNIFLVSDHSTRPLLSASVHIPVCDLLPIEI